jgi:hypothetical protein
MRPFEEYGPPVPPIVEEEEGESKHKADGDSRSP